MLIKTLSQARIVPAFAIALLTTTNITQPSAAEEITFFCGTSNDTPATIARTSRGEVPVIVWNSSNVGSSSDTPQQRCEDVSQKFQTYYSNGTLKYITTERKNGQLVACVAPKENEPCTGVLFPLNSTEGSPKDTLQRIFRIRVASAAPISETRDRVYISLDKYLNGDYPNLAPKGDRTPPIPPKPSVR